MDRAQELRTLMKIASKKSDVSAGSNGVTGKDKAKLLKMMKEKQRSDESSNVVLSKPKELHATTKAKSTPSQTIQVPQSIKASKLPDNFFDNENAPTIISNQQPVKAALTKMSAPDATIASKSNTSQMPIGFFDNPTEELTARGVNIVLHKAEQQKIVDNEFQSFLSEIKVLKEEAEEEVLEEAGHEAVSREFEEQAVQMAYMTKLAKLYQQSEAVVDKHSRPQCSSSAAAKRGGEGGDDFNEVIALSSSGSGGGRERNDDSTDQISSTSASNEETSTGAPAVREDVESVLYRKLQMESLRKRRMQQQHALITQQSKRAKESVPIATEDSEQNEQQQQEDEDEEEEEEDSESEEEDEEDESYSPLDFMDWTSKGV